MNYDAAGNQTKDTYSAAAVSRAYDAENRMTSETQAGSNVAGNYSYDGDGRRVKRNVGGAETWQVYGLGGELLAEYAANASYSSPQKEYGYRNGQLVVTATIGTGWGSPPAYTAPDPLVAGVEIKLEHLTELRTAVNQLRAHAGLSAATFTVDSTPVRYVTDVKADHILQLRSALEGARSHLGLSTGGYEHPNLHTGDWIYAIDFQELRNQIAAAWSSVQVYWLVSDQLGTPRMTFDESGSLGTVSRHDYLPFGEELFAGTGGRSTAQGYTLNDSVRQKFTQKERDNETGLDWFGPGRYYSSVQGRFTSVDPSGAGSRVTNPQSLNRYTYTLNRPTIAIDPDGLSTIVVTVSVPAGGGNPTATISMYGTFQDGQASTRNEGLAAGVAGRDRMQTNADTPYGIYSFGGTQGGTADSRLGVAFGTGKIIISGVSGEIMDSGRSLIRLHGGGTALGDHAYDLQQDLLPTEGCVRMHNGDVNALIGDISIVAANNDPLDRVFIGSATALNTMANQTDRNSNYVNPDLRLAMGMYNNDQERQNLMTADANRRAEAQRQREEQQRQRQERQRQRQRRRHPEDQ